MRRVGMFLLLVLVAVVWFVWIEPDADPAGAPQANPTPTASAAIPSSLPELDVPSADPPGPASAEESLPPEARETIAAIDAGGPYKYDRDDSVFQNREGRLPSQPRGYWREYTVDTPGSSDRGARRLVEGKNGELYYTDDHYGSFRLIRAGNPR